MVSPAVGDGPVEYGRCERCMHWCGEDVYRWLGAILCGDCRFYERHGFWPTAAKAWIMSGLRVVRKRIREDDLATTETQGRFLPTEVVSARHAELLIEMERDLTSQPA